MIRVVCLLAMFGSLTLADSVVEPPTNVTLHCRNLQNVLTWSYVEVPEGLRFRVEVRQLVGDMKVFWVDPPAQQVDLSSFSDPRNDYFISVVAVIGNNVSDSSPPDGIDFSYQLSSPAKQKCIMDLPWVNVTAKENDHVIFRFEHPWVFHKKNSNTKLRRKKSYEAQDSKSVPAFNYKVVVDNKAQHNHICEESVCEHSLRLNTTQKHCLNITGEVKQVLVKSTQQYCIELEASPVSNNNYIAFIVVGLLTVGVVAFIAFLIYQKQTSPSSSLPQSVVIKDQKKLRKLSLEQEKIHVLEIDTGSPNHLLPNAEEAESINTPVATTEPDIRGHIGNFTEDEVCDDLGEGNDDGWYRPGRYLDDDEADCPKESSGYEKREVVNLGPGDQAEGYRGLGIP